MKILLQYSLWVVLLSCGLAAHGELSPQAYYDMQQSAPENLFIRVKSSNVDSEDAGKKFIRVEADVKKVVRSASGLKEGQRITIRYEKRALKTGLIGPHPIPDLADGSEVPAYLKHVTNGHYYNPEYYEPVAKGCSFQTIGVKAATVYSSMPEENHKKQPWQNPKP
jgi:hypothetical protein